MFGKKLVWKYRTSAAKRRMLGQTMGSEKQKKKKSVAQMTKRF